MSTSRGPRWELLSQTFMLGWIFHVQLNRHAPRRVRLRGWTECNLQSQHEAVSPRGGRHGQGKTSGSADYLPVICVADSKPSGELTHKLSRYNITIRKKTPTQARGEYWVPPEDEARSEDQNAVEMSTSQKLKYADSSNKSKSLKNTLFRFLHLEIFWI